jgi:hypothetical protein
VMVVRTDVVVMEGKTRDTPLVYSYGRQQGDAVYTAVNQQERAGSDALPSQHTSSSNS